MNHSEPIITSLLDTDFYKFTMGQVVFRHFRDVHVKYAFKNRTAGIPLAEIIKEEDLRRELDHVTELRANNSELHYLRGTNEYSERMFSEDYLQFLNGLKLPAYNLRRVRDAYSLEFSGLWSEAIYWEIYALPIINELYYRSLLGRLTRFQRDAVYAQGKIRLAEKIRTLGKHPGIIFSDSGTRRRFSRELQEYDVGVLAEELPKQFLGTSNVYLAMKYGLMPMGTSAHEMFMVMAGIIESNGGDIRDAQNEILKLWWQSYGHGLSIALNDTFGSDFFFRTALPDIAREWKGLRLDSGDPIEEGEKAIAWYESYGVDAKTKLIIPSDGLDVETMIKIHDHFKGRIRVSFGWGTNLTNDLGLKALSLVIKTVEANGRGLVKLSNNLAKAIGAPEDIERYKKIFGYTGGIYQECRY